MSMVPPELGVGAFEGWVAIGLRLLNSMCDIVSNSVSIHRGEGGGSRNWEGRWGFGTDPFL
jgi:hypothetical protein